MLVNQMQSVTNQHKIMITVKENTANLSKQHSYIQNTAILSISTVIISAVPRALNLIS